MSDQPTFEQFWALRAEAEEARGLASSFTDRRTVIDIECYASELEAEAAKLRLAQELSRPNRHSRPSHEQFVDLGTIIWARKRPSHAQK